MEYFKKKGYTHELTKEAKALTFKVETTVTAEQIENIIVNSLEAQSTFWLGLDNLTDEWDNAPDDLPASQYATQLILEGKAVTVTVDGGIEEYAKAFLHIFNNVREANELFKVDNYAWNNDITVYCDIESKEALTEYLENFGKIKHTKKVLMYQLQGIDYDLDKYDEQVIVPYFE